MKDPQGPVIDVETLAPAHGFREAVAFGLRDVQAGVDVGALALRHRVDGGDVVATLRSFPDDVVCGDDGRFRLTRRGTRFADRVARAVLQG